MTPHPNLKAHRAAASGSGALPPWTPSYHRGGAGDTLAWGKEWDGSGAGETLAWGWCVWGVGYIMALRQVGSSRTGWFYLVQSGSDWLDHLSW
jgi:hypothetical protein